MAQMTLTPVATHGLFLDGKWLEEGDIVEVRAPYDGSLIAHVRRKSFVKGKHNSPEARSGERAHRACQVTPLGAKFIF
jgi:hypothetical protein